MRKPVGVTLFDLHPIGEQQLDLLASPQAQETRTKHEAATAAIDTLNAKYGKTLVHVGTWSPPPGGFAGEKSRSHESRPQRTFPDELENRTDGGGSGARSAD